MSLKRRLEIDVAKTFYDQWELVATAGVPGPTELKLNANYAKELKSATVLYADLNGSTRMVDHEDWRFSAEVYKTYLRCTSEIIKSESGRITAYDGDRVMAIYTGDHKNTQAVTSALKINYAIKNILQPALDRQYPTSGFKVKHVVGIDTAFLRAARIGVHGDNDIVWVGRAANYAAKLTSLSEGTTWITKAVYDVMLDKVKYSNGQDIWEARKWTSMDDFSIYRTNYWMPFD